MRKRNDVSAHCVVRDNRRKPYNTEMRTGPRNCRILDSVQRVMALGLSAVAIEDAGMSEATLQALCEYARLDEKLDFQHPTELVDVALDTLAQETHKVDVEIEMLRLRKRALTKRARLLHKLAAMLRERGSG